MGARRAIAILVVIGIAITGAAVWSPAVQADVTTISVAEATYATEWEPDGTRGDRARLRVDGGSPERISYLKFQVEGLDLPPALVTLQLYATESHEGFEVHPVESTDWSEETLTYETRPDVAPEVIATSGVLEEDTWVSLDVTSLVTGSGTYSIALVTSSLEPAQLLSDEGRFAPHLLVEGDVVPSPSPTETSSASPTPSASATPTPTETPTTEPSATPTPEPTPSVTPTATETPTPTPPSGPSVTLMAAGDIACEPGAAVTATTCQHQATSDLLVGASPDAVLTLGDNQYENGALSDYLASYDPTWGRVKSITRPVPGNHEYNSGAVGYFAYFGAAAGAPTEGYYSYDLGAWHVVALNSEVDHSAGSAQASWLRDDLAAHPVACTLAYWHRPLFSSAQHGNQGDVAPLWDALYEGGVDVVLNGHDHAYERFAPQDPSGTLDLARGIREFVVGTGGKSHYALSGLEPNSEAGSDTSFGVLELTLGAAGYDWRFVPAAGDSFSDAGSDVCH